MHGDWLADDKAIGDELADGLAGVRVRDFADFIWIEPDLALTATDNGSGQALLSAKVDPVDELISHVVLQCCAFDATLEDDSDAAVMLKSRRIDSLMT